MELYIAGGCQEHGRNSFLIIGKPYSILVDCGISKGDNQPYPYLSKQHISKIKYLFLTHSHKDHCGGIEWLIRKGFSGKIISSEETRQQSGITYQNWKRLYFDNCCPGKVKIDASLSVTYGRSGHCTGGLWYLLQFEDKRILFSGDYSEKSNLYKCDKLKNINANIAVLDCGDGNSKADTDSLKEILCNKLKNCIKEKRTVLLPVPKYGRGLELVCMLEAIEESIHIYVDSMLYQQIKVSDEHWHTHQIQRQIRHLSHWFREPAIIVVSDAQLSSVRNQRFADKFIELGGHIVFTGHIYKNTYADFLFNNGNAQLFQYPVHMNYHQARTVCSDNQFEKVVLFHSADIISDKSQLTECVSVKDTLEI